MSKRKANEIEEDEELLTFRPKKSRNNLSVAQKIEIILYADDYPKLSHTKIASHFSTKFGLKVPIGQSTIGQIIKNRATY